MVYEAEVATNTTYRKYYEMSEGELKSRYNNQGQSFRHMSHINDAELSKYFWLLKANGTEHSPFFKEIHEVVIRNLTFEIIFTKQTQQFHVIKGPETKKAKKNQRNTHELSCNSHERKINNCTKTE